mmetsp:Transcript_22694/g.25831  ORF Transcript_22694/g.25831 Transcript_22694/m.25831 type:complete len:113 (+) Transcript_22694:71-409(+)
MDALLLGSAAFSYVFYKINPTELVDKVVKFAANALVPGRGAGQNNWFMQNWRALEQSAEKSSREMEIRAELRRWDQQFPELHHELIVRGIAGLVASSIVSSVISMVRPSRRK